MKKILFWSAVTFFSAVSCNKEMETPAVPGDDTMTFVATVDGADTKTVLDGVKNYWNGTEHIGVLDGTVYKFFTAADLVKSETAEFTEDDPEVQLTGDDYVAIYPSYNANWSGDIADPVKGLWLNPDQYPMADTYDPGAHVAVAYTNAEGNELMFKNVSALIKFTIGNENASNPCFYGNNGEIISGNFDVLYNNGDPVVTGIVDPVPETYYYQTYAKLTGGVNVGNTYYIAVHPTTFEKGFTFELEVEGMKYTKTTQKAVTLERNRIIDLGTITFEPVEVGNKTVYFKPGEIWKADGAWFSTWCWYEGHEGRWYDMSDPDGDGIYEVEVPETITNIIFVRMSAGTTADWNNKLDQTGDLTVSDECYVYDAASWMPLADAENYVKPEVTDTVWYLVGSFNYWAVADENYRMALEGGYYVFRNLTFSAESEVKFNVGDWSVNRGGDYAANAAIDVVHGGANIKVPAGTYDVYLSADATKAYFMTDGRTPAGL